MLKVERDDCGIDTFIVYNDYGDVVLYTIDEQLANFVNAHIKGVKRDLRLSVGGDYVLRRDPRKVFHKKQR